MRNIENQSCKFALSNHRFSSHFGFHQPALLEQIPDSPIGQTSLFRRLGNCVEGFVEYFGVYRHLTPSCVPEIGVDWNVGFSRLLWQVKSSAGLVLAGNLVVNF